MMKMMLGLPAWAPVPVLADRSARARTQATVVTRMKASGVELQTLAHEHTGQGVPRHQRGITAAGLLETVRPVELDAGQRRLDLNGRCPVFDCMSLRQSQQRRPDAQSGSGAANVHGHAVFRVVDPMGRKPEHNEFTLKVSQRDEECFPAFHRPNVDIGCEAFAPRLDQIMRVEPRTDGTDRVAMRVGNPSGIAWVRPPGPERGPRHGNTPQILIPVLPRAEDTAERSRAHRPARWPQS